MPTDRESRLEAIVRELEWSRQVRGVGRVCPLCDSEATGESHTPGCPLFLALSTPSEPSGERPCPECGVLRVCDACWEAHPPSGEGRESSGYDGGGGGEWTPCTGTREPVLRSALEEIVWEYEGGDGRPGVMAATARRALTEASEPPRATYQGTHERTGLVHNADDPEDPAEFYEWQWAGFAAQRAAAARRRARRRTAAAPAEAPEAPAPTGTRDETDWLAEITKAAVRHGEVICAMAVNARASLDAPARATGEPEANEAMAQKSGQDPS